MEPFNSETIGSRKPSTEAHPENEKEEAYTQQAIKNEHTRQESIRDELHYWIIWLIRGFLSAALISGLVYFYHMITPEYFTWNGCNLMRLHFLSGTQLDKISAFFVTVVLSSTFTSYSKKYFK